MVARITIPSSIEKTLNYNEKKVKKGTAVCIGQNGFLLPLKKMNFYHKLEGFEKRNGLNERARTKTLHVSLNFSTAEQLTKEKLLTIGNEYMERLGFADQPYLIYHHLDAGHPHIHIVSSTIRENGTRIATHNIGRNQSEIARKAVEEKYGLQKAGNGIKIPGKESQLFDILKVQYGQTETKRGITNVLNAVFNTYNYTSLPEFNAVLKQFNVVADRGDEHGFIYSKRGLLYKVLDTNGVKVGVPVKASAINGKPTLDKLERKFDENQRMREPLKNKLRETIDQAISTIPKSLSELVLALQKNEVVSVLRQSEDGRIYGITFVDNKNQSVFNGSEIGKQYSVAGLLKQINDVEKIQHNILPTMQENGHQKTERGFIEFNGLPLLSELIKPVEEFNPTPYHLKKKKRKRKRMS
jgi:hypothetical protein